MDARQVATTRRGADDPDVRRLGSRPAAPTASAATRVAAPLAPPAQALLRLQRSAGNAAVVQLLASVPERRPSVQREEDEWSAGASDAPGEAMDAGEAAGEAVDAGGRSEADMERKAEEGEPSETDEEVPQEGGPPPSARPADPAPSAIHPVAASGFHDLGRVATVPFGSGGPDGMDEHEAMHPHAFTAGGRMGTVSWAGGGSGKGPKGNQGTGSITTEVVPEYDTRSNGPASNADAWVRAGTGVADVTRSFVGSAAGDQGNGWWISAAAAAALDAHEQRHVTASKQVYDAKIQPMLDRVADSANLGKGKTYWASDAIALLKRQIGWADALKGFKDDDAAYNANQGEVDLGDYGRPHYPRNMRGPRTIGGKSYDFYLIMGSEPDPT